MDTYGHLFLSRIPAIWIMGPTEAENAQAHPEEKREEQESDKLRKKVVAVTRIERVTRGL
jgi:hypothetical protein